MKQLIVITAFLATSLLSRAQYYDTIRVGTGVTTLIEFKGDAEIRQLDISGSATSNIQQARLKDLYYAVMDSTASILKLKATRSFSGKIILTVFSDTTVQYLVKFVEDPSRTYYSYNLSRGASLAGSNKVKQTKKAATGDETSVDQHFIDVAAGKDDANDLRTNLEKNAGTLMNPKNKLFTAMRSKNQNITIGDIRGGVRVYLQKFYKSRELTYFQFKIANYSMGDFQLAEFAINKVEGGSDSKLTVIHEESAFNLLKRYEKVDFIAIAENVEINSSGKLVFTFKGAGDKGKGFQFTMESKDFQKREPL